MGDGLQQAAGDKLRFYIDKYTSNPFLGVLIGIVMTALIQSSSGVTVIVVGLVSAGLLSLRQAIGIVMGANIGTTVTSFMIGFKLGDYALPVIFLGAALLFFTSNKKLNNLGRILFGVGGIFFPLNLMGDAVEPLKSVTAFKDYLATLGDRPVMGVIIGAGLTMLIQSSAATIGILQSLYSGGLLDLQGALPILFGDNISYQSTDDLLKAWKKAGLKFPKKVKLLSVFQSSPGDVSNFHTAIAYEKDGSIYVFEKQDPTLPYRWSRFNNWADIKTHWLSNRFKVFKDNVDILVNDQKFDDFLENTLYIPQNNQLAPQDK